ncbi:hypothetical protein BDA96_06G019200 [Sorghum bicolor]|uniref:Uncharacterized protein n=1 Tax=Sorghum bicolor TaxID=4558 RepID=A0A921Q9L4_SORBI|nr:hypothetical protein BDA96_09G109300 [Sorghum bicolor]KAG0525018.1 hypothetical protein BDA96_06G019200 [Sorghum bicolor]
MELRLKEQELKATPESCAIFKYTIKELKLKLKERELQHLVVELELFGDYNKLRFYPLKTRMTMKSLRSVQ